MERDMSQASKQAFKMDSLEVDDTQTYGSNHSLATSDFDTLFEMARERQEIKCIDDFEGETNFGSPLLDKPMPRRRTRSEKGRRYIQRFHHTEKPRSLDDENLKNTAVHSPIRRHHGHSVRSEGAHRTDHLHTDFATLNLDLKHHRLEPDTSEQVVKPKTSPRHRLSLTSKAHSTDSGSGSSHTGHSDTSSVCGFRRVRSFRITSRGIEKEDLVVKSSKECVKNNVMNRVRREHSGSLDRVTGSSHNRPNHLTHKVLLLGSEGVGKRAMIYDFMMADDYLEQLGFSLNDDEDGEKSVSILLDGEESTLEFVDLSDDEISNFINAEQIDAYVVVYSVEDRRSFETAIDRLFEIRQDDAREVAVILVANKTDLVRTRVIFEEEGKAAANTYDSKYIEVSAAIDHKIDELLVGILKQIRLIKELRGTKHHQTRRGSVSENKDSEKKFCCPLRAKHSVIEKLFGKTKRSAKSCENLYVL